MDTTKFANILIQRLRKRADEYDTMYNKHLQGMVHATRDEALHERATSSALKEVADCIEEVIFGETKSSQEGL